MTSGAQPWSRLKLVDGMYLGRTVITVESHGLIIIMWKPWETL